MKTLCFSISRKYYCLSSIICNCFWNVFKKNEICAPFFCFSPFICWTCAQNIPSNSFVLCYEHARQFFIYFLAGIRVENRDRNIVWVLQNAQSACYSICINMLYCLFNARSLDTFVIVAVPNNFFFFGMELERSKIGYFYCLREVGKK